MRNGLRTILLVYGLLLIAPSNRLVVPQSVNDLFIGLARSAVERDRRAQ
jgi:hypothetical protein